MSAARYATTAAALGAAAAVAAGCGGGSPSHKASSDVAAAPGAPQISAAQRAQMKAAQAQVSRSLHQVSHARYGGAPRYLPKPQYDKINRVKTATGRHQVLAIEGDTVKLRLPGSSAQASVVGPIIPSRDEASFRTHAPASFNVVLRDVHGRLPLSPDTWTVTDEQGVTHHPTVAAAKPRAEDGPGARRIVLTTHLSIGNGRVRYAPAGRDAVPVVQWDFDNETD